MAEGYGCLRTATKGKLERIDPREYWKDEAEDFTPWLAQEENLELLGGAIGLQNLDLQYRY